MLYDPIAITKRLVFGTENPSPFPFYTNHIRPDGAIPEAITYDMQQYMTLGGGRYAYPRLFPVVESFFSASNLGSGSYTYDQILQELPPFIPFTAPNEIGISQYGTDLSSPDHAERSYIFGSTSFVLVPTGVLFNVTPGGERTISNMEIRAYDDNFDYQSDNPFVQFLSGPVLTGILDPYNLRRVAVPIEFRTGGGPGVGAMYPNYTSESYDNSALDATAVSYTPSLDFFLKDTAGLAQLGITGLPYIYAMQSDTFLSYVREGRKVVYGTPNDDVVILDIFTSNPPNPLQLFIAGAGNDSLYGNGSDQLYGHTGDDVLLVFEAPAPGFTLDSPGNNTLSGGAGNDTYRPFNSTDTVFEFPNDGTDLIIAGNTQTFDYFIDTTKRANVESVTNLDRSKWAADGTNNVIDVATLNAENVKPINMALEVYSVGGNDTIIGANGGSVPIL